MLSYTVLACCCVLVFRTAYAFNLDTQHYTLQRAPGQTPAMFGFTVAAHKERGQSWVMVGAPEAQSRYHSDIVRGGAVYRCDPTEDNACYEIQFDKNGTTHDNRGTKVDDKTRQWFGATMSSGGEDAPFVACAPRYVILGLSKIEPVGNCYVARNSFSEMLEYAPCRTRDSGYHRQGYCQAGLGAAISKDGHRLYIGAPGSWYWQGRLFSINPTVQFPFMPPRMKEYGEGQVYSFNMVERQSVFSTKESGKEYDNTYMGYSVATGDFVGRAEQGVAVGMPRGSELRGKVVMYSWDLQNIQNITGEQIGGYFGYSLCAADVDGDGFDDLIVGAPLYTIPNNERKYEMGRVYIIYQNSEEGRYQRFHYRDGINSRARFGLSVAGLGDINLDGYGDFAVGAPYDGPNGRGAVYIYHGEKNGAREKPSQIIMAEDIQDNSLSTFGFSVSGGIDLDTNEYNDLVVGAYDSDSAVLFRSKPVVYMTAGVEFVSDTNFVSLNDKKCMLVGKRKKVPCTNIKYCLKYDGIGVDTEVANGYVCQLEFILRINLDTQKPHEPRLLFMTPEGKNTMNRTITLTRDVLYCNNLTVYITDNVRDKLTPIEAEIQYFMRSKNIYSERDSTRNPRASLSAVLDQNTLNSKKASINIQKNCGPDNICIPDLRLYADSNVKTYLLGSNEHLIMRVNVENRGEDAFEATYNINLPPGINFVKINQLGDTSIPVQCSPTKNMLKCDIGNPLPKEQLVQFHVLLEPFYKHGMPLHYNFSMDVNSTNPENANSVNDNQKDITVPIWVETKFEIESYSTPPELHYNASLYPGINLTYEADIGPQLIHLYTFKNKGASVIDKAEVYIAWPYETEAGDSLMYVLEEPKYSGQIECFPAEHINDFHLQIDTKKRNYLESHKAALQGNLQGSGEGISISGKDSFNSSSGSVSSSESKSWNYSSTSGSKEGSWKVHKEKNWSSQGAKQSFAGTDKKPVNKLSEDNNGRTYVGQTHSGEHVVHGAQVRNGTKVVYQGGDGNKQIFIEKDSKEKQDKNYIENKYPYDNKFVYDGSKQITVDGHETIKHIDENGRWVTQYHIPSTTYNKTYFSNWNTTKFGAGSPGVYHFRNISTIKGKDGEIIESSTEYYITGNEGETTSLFNNKINGIQNVNRTITKIYGSNEQSQGGSTRYGFGSYSSGGARHYKIKDKQYSLENNGSFGNMNWNQGGGEGASSGRHYTWSTEETVNKDLINAGAGFHKSEERESQNKVVAGNTFLGSSQEPKGLEAVAGGQGFRTTTWELESSNSGSAHSGDNIGGQGFRTNSWESSNSGGGRIGSDAGGQGFRTSSWESSNSGGGRIGSNAGGQGFRTSSWESSNSGGARTGSNVGGQGYRTSSWESSSSGGAHTGSNVSGQGFRTGTWESSSGGTRSGDNIGGQGFRTSSWESSGNSGGARIGSNNGRQGLKTNKWEEESSYSGGANSGIDSTNMKSNQYNENKSGFKTQKSFSSSYETQWEGEPPENIQDNNKPHEYFRWEKQARNKRQVYQDDINEKQLKDAMKCSGLKCAVFKCIAGPLIADQEIMVAIRSRVNVQTLEKLASERPITLSSVGVIRVLELPYIGVPAERPPHAQQAISVLTPVAPLQPAEPVPLWVVVLSACVGTALLLLLIFALYKCRFFERNRPEAPERQPLNRNGYGHGDEQL